MGGERLEIAHTAESVLHAAFRGRSTKLKSTLAVMWSGTVIPAAPESAAPGSNRPSRLRLKPETFQFQ